MTILICFCIHIMFLILSIVLFTLTVINRKRYHYTEYSCMLFAWASNAGLNVAFLIPLIVKVLN